MLLNVKKHKNTKCTLFPIKMFNTGIKISASHSLWSSLFVNQLMMKIKSINMIRIPNSFRHYYFIYKILLLQSVHKTITDFCSWWAIRLVLCWASLLLWCVCVPAKSVLNNISSKIVAQILKKIDSYVPRIMLY